MAADKISPHEVRILSVLLGEPERWLTNAELAVAARVSPRTARLHTAQLVRLGVLDVEVVFPANKYRLASRTEEPGRAYMARWHKAKEVLGL